MKQRHRALPADLLTDANHFIPPALFSRAARLTFGLATSRPGRPLWNLVVSNVPGPQLPLYCAGARLVANYPVSVITDGMGLNITVMSLDGHLDVGIVADREQMPVSRGSWAGSGRSSPRSCRPRRRAGGAARRPSRPLPDTRSAGRASVSSRRLSPGMRRTDPQPRPAHSTIRAPAS